MLKFWLRETALRVISSIVTVHDPVKPLYVANTGPNYCLIDKNQRISKNTIEQFCQTHYPNLKLRITKFENGPFAKSKFSFQYQSAESRKLARLKRKYNVDLIIEGQDNDFNEMIALCNWVNQQWRHGTSGAGIFQQENFDADLIIEAAKKGKQFWCQVYVMTFIQLASSVGIQSRMISLSEDGHKTGKFHVVAEIWSNHYKKWVVIDVDFNLCYFKNNIPMNVHEIHNALINDDVSTILIKKGINRPPFEYESRIPKLYKFYRYFFVHMRNDWLDNQYFPGHPKRSDKATLYWIDERLPKIKNHMSEVTALNDLYWNLNLSEIGFDSANKKARSIKVYCSTITPNFRYFKIKNDSSKETVLNRDYYQWMIHKGNNSIDVKSINKFGREGPTSCIEFDLYE